MTDYGNDTNNDFDDEIADMFRHLETIDAPEFETIRTQAWVARVSAEPAGAATADVPTPNAVTHSTVDVDLSGETEPATARPNRVRFLVGALMIALLAVVGLAFVGGSNVDQSSVATTPEVGQLTEGQVADVAVAEPRFFDDGLTGGPVTGFGPSSDLVAGPGVEFVDGEFVTLGRDDDGVIVARSTNGTDWVETSVTGLPTSASPVALTRAELGWLVVIELWPFADTSRNYFFSEGEQPQRMLATSPDLLNWDVEVLPEIVVPEEGDVRNQGIALSGDTVAVLFSAVDEGNSDGGAVQPGEPGGENERLVALVGSPSNPFEIVDIVFGDTPKITRAEISGSNDGFVVVVSDFQSETITAIPSDSGLAWGEPEVIASGVVSFEMDAEGDRLLVVAEPFNADGGPIALASTNLGRTWTERSAETELSPLWMRPQIGPAGFAYSARGRSFEDTLARVTSEGFEIEWDYRGGSYFLNSPSGERIHDAVSDLAAADGIDGVVRQDGDTLVWLDPETGEDLVTFDLEELREASSGQPPRTIETWWSSDGDLWTLIDVRSEGPETFTDLAAVGDDEALLATSSEANPVPEEFFEAADANIEPDWDAIDAWRDENPVIEVIEWSNVAIE